MHELRLQARRVLGKLFRFHPSVCSIVCLAKHKIDHRRRERDGYRRHGFGSLRFKPVVYVAHSKISNEPLTGSNWTSIPCSIVKPTSPTAFSKLRQRQFERTIKIMSERAHVDIVFRCWQCWMFCISLEHQEGVVFSKGFHTSWSRLVVFDEFCWFVVEQWMIGQCDDKYVDYYWVIYYDRLQKI